MITAVTIGWMWIETALGIWLWISYRHYVKASRVAEAALQAHRIAAAKERAALLTEHIAAQNALMESFTERLRQVAEDLRTRQNQQDPTNRKATP